MKNPILPFLFLISFFLFTSCEKENISAAYSTQEEAVFSLSNLKEIIVFHYSQLDIATHERTGFIIDKYGNVKTYHLSADDASNLPKGTKWSEDDAYFLFKRANTKVMEIDEETMKEFYHKILSTTTGELSEEMHDATAPFTQSFHAFKAHTQYTSSGSCQGGGCGNGSSYQTSTTTHNQQLLLVEGAEQQQNLHMNAAQIVEWMKGMKVEAGL